MSLIGYGSYAAVAPRSLYIKYGNDFSCHHCADIAVEQNPYMVIGQTGMMYLCAFDPMKASCGDLWTSDILRDYMTSIGMSAYSRFYVICKDKVIIVKLEQSCPMEVES